MSTPRPGSRGNHQSVMRNKKLQFVIGVTALMLLSVVIYGWAMQPATGTPIQTAAPTANAAPASTTLQTAYYSTVVSGVYSVINQRDNISSPVLSSVAATQTGNGRGRIAITVAKIPNTGLSEVADIRSRKERADRYEQITVSRAPEAAVAFRSKDAHEISLFWPHDSLYASVVITTTTGSVEYADSQLVDMIQSWTWL